MFHTLQVSSLWHALTLCHDLDYCGGLRRPPKRKQSISSIVSFAWEIQRSNTYFCRDGIESDAQIIRAGSKVSLEPFIMRLSLLTQCFCCIKPDSLRPRVMVKC